MRNPEEFSASDVKSQNKFEVLYQKTIQPFDLLILKSKEAKSQKNAIQTNNSPFHNQTGNFQDFVLFHRTVFEEHFAHHLGNNLT